MSGKEEILVAEITRERMIELLTQARDSAIRRGYQGATDEEILAEVDRWEKQKQEAGKTSDKMNKED